MFSLVAIRRRIGLFLVLSVLGGMGLVAATDTPAGAGGVKPDSVKAQGGQGKAGDESQQSDGKTRGGGDRKADGQTRGERSDVLPTGDAAKDSAFVGEDDRTEIVDNGDGTKTAKISVGPSSVQTVDGSGRRGKRKKIDVSLREAVGRLESDGGAERVSIALDSDAQDLVTIGVEGRRLRLKRPNSSGVDVASSVVSVTPVASTQGPSASSSPKSPCASTDGPVSTAPNPVVSGSSEMPKLSGSNVSETIVVPANSVVVSADLMAVPSFSCRATANDSAGRSLSEVVAPAGKSDVSVSDDGATVVANSVGDGVRGTERAKKTRKVRAQRKGVSEASFVGAFGGGTELRYEVLGDGVKESIVLDRVPAGVSVSSRVGGSDAARGSGGWVRVFGWNGQGGVCIARCICF